VETIKIAYPDIAANDDSRELYNAIHILLLENETSNANHAPVICWKKSELKFYKDLILRWLEVIEVPEWEDNVIYAWKELSKWNIHAVLAWNISSTGHVVTVWIKEIWMQEWVKRSSSYFLMNHPEYWDYIFADSGLQPNPEPEQLIEIVKLTFENAKIHWITPKIALLDGWVSSRKMDEVNKYFEKYPIEGAEIFWNISFEEALEQGCGLFIFPDLNSGNILYKAAERMWDMNVFETHENQEKQYWHTEFSHKWESNKIFAYHNESISPSADELFQTALSAIEVARQKWISPQVAFLTFSTAWSGKDFPTILPARQAAKMLKNYVDTNGIKDLIVLEQEVQLDTALLPDKAKKKWMEIENPSTIYIMPDMHTAKMIWPLVDTLWWSSANGPRFQWFKFPIHDFSRWVGASGITMWHKTTEMELSK